jgi:homoserine kinase
MKAEALVGRSVTVAVPATVANLGAGYDVLGLALEMTNELTVQVTGIATSGKGTVTYGASGEGAEELAPNRTNMALDAVYRGLSIAGVTGADALDLAVTAVNTIPLSRGLGSSAAAIVGGLFAGAALAGTAAGASGASGACFESFSDPLTDKLFAAADEIEGHPDNVAARRNPRGADPRRAFRDERHARRVAEDRSDRRRGAQRLATCVGHYCT